MPKKPADKVIIHRIEFQETERELLKSVLTAYSFRNVTKGIFNLTSDVTTVVLLIIAVEYVFKITILDDVLLGALGLGTVTAAGLAAALAESWANYTQTDAYREQYYDRAGSVTGGIHNIFDQIIGVFTGEFYGRVQENFEQS